MIPGFPPSRAPFPLSDHCDGERFFVPNRPYVLGLRDILRWKMSGGRQRWPTALPPRARDIAPMQAQHLRVTLIGHASLLVQTDTLNLLVDPVFAKRASPVKWAGPKRLDPPGIDWDDLPPIDAVLLTHNHYDHLDMTALRRLETRFKPIFIMPLGNERLILRFAAPERVHRLDWHQSHAVGDADVRLVPAQHWSSRSPFDRNRMLWGGYVLTAKAGTCYIAGDTGWNREFLREIAGYGPFRLAVLPIGAYEPRWFMQYSHMNPAEAVMAFELLGAEHAIGYHWGSFQLTDEARDQPREDLAAALSARSIEPERFRAFEAGDVWQIE